MNRVRILLLGCLLISISKSAFGVRGSFGSIGGETERELTFEIGAGKEECFFENVEQGNIIDIEYQVMITLTKNNGLVEDPVS